MATPDERPILDYSKPPEPRRLQFGELLKRLWHIPWLGGSFVVSLVMVVLLSPFAGPDGTGILLMFLFGATVLAHFVALIVGLALGKRTWWRPVIIVGIAMIPAVWLSISQLHDAWYLRHQAVYDRFVENLGGPVPASVSDLQFVPFEEAQESHLMFRFAIAPEDLDRIIRSKGFTQITDKQFRRPDDLFTRKEYLPLDGPVTFYVFNDIQAGYPDKGIGEGYAQSKWRQKACDIQEGRGCVLSLRILEKPRRTTHEQYDALRNSKAEKMKSVFSAYWKTSFTRALTFLKHLKTSFIRAETSLELLETSFFGAKTSFIGAKRSFKLSHTSFLDGSI